MIMERKLLASDGIILADNSISTRNTSNIVLSNGCTVDSSAGNPQDSAVRNGAELRKFNDHIASDDRVDVCVLPMFDGLALIKWRPGMYPLQRTQSHLSIHNGFGANAARPRSIHRGSFDLHNQRSPSRNSHDLSRTGTPSFHSRRLSDEEIEEKDEFSYGFSNRRKDDEEEEEHSSKKLDDHFRPRNQFVHPVGGFESRNKYYD
jgi:hypothetical protein